jgi:hypothetical protein
MVISVVEQYCTCRHDRVNDGLGQNRRLQTEDGMPLEYHQSIDQQSPHADIHLASYRPIPHMYIDCISAVRIRFLRLCVPRIAFSHDTIPRDSLKHYLKCYYLVASCESPSLRLKTHSNMLVLISHVPFQVSWVQSTLVRKTSNAIISVKL